AGAAGSGARAAAARWRPARRRVRRAARTYARPYPQHVLDLLPLNAELIDGALHIGGIRASDLADEHGTPLLVYSEETIRAQARAFLEAAPKASIFYGTKAFANVELMRVLADEGVGADVST